MGKTRRRRETNAELFARLDAERARRTAEIKARREREKIENPIRADLYDVASRWHVVRAELVRDTPPPLIRYALEQEKARLEAQMQAAADAEVAGVRIPLCRPDKGWYIGVRRMLA
jgi:hypothetical protein